MNSAAGSTATSTEGNSIARRAGFRRRPAQSLHHSRSRRISRPGSRARTELGLGHRRWQAFRLLKLLEPGNERTFLARIESSSRREMPGVSTSMLNGKKLDVGGDYGRGENSYDRPCRIDHPTRFRSPIPSKPEFTSFFSAYLPSPARAVQCGLLPLNVRHLRFRQFRCARKPSLVTF